MYSLNKIFAFSFLLFVITLITVVVVLDKDKVDLIKEVTGVYSGQLINVTLVTFDKISKETTDILFEKDNKERWRCMGWHGIVYLKGLVGPTNDNIRATALWRYITKYKEGHAVGIYWLPITDIRVVNKLPDGVHMINNKGINTSVLVSDHDTVYTDKTNTINSTTVQHAPIYLKKIQ